MIRAVLAILLICLGRGLSSEYRNTCGQNQVLFLGKCWCEPGWEPPDCVKPVLTNGDCDCLSSSPNDRSFLTNTSWTHPKGYRCEALCKWNKDVGVPRSTYVEWKDNQVWRQLSFYQKDLPRPGTTHLRVRLDEFNEGFKTFSYLKGADFGDVIELGNYTIALSSCSFLFSCIFLYFLFTSCSSNII